MMEAIALPTEPQPLPVGVMATFLFPINPFLNYTLKWKDERQKGCYETETQL